MHASTCVGDAVGVVGVRVGDHVGVIVAFVGAADGANDG